MAAAQSPAQWSTLLWQLFAFLGGGRSRSWRWAREVRPPFLCGGSRRARALTEGSQERVIFETVVAVVPQVAAASATESIGGLLRTQKKNKPTRCGSGQRGLADGDVAAGVARAVHKRELGRMAEVVSEELEGI
ncbi:uncharacterized protein A4U43_C06F10870 [Asparagus officinalis]|uniref:Uncharacterized protein n=1 Tax=Asparagus officinalis TaxID=4686 RepID=A0A5P1EQ54_ASPOF|nr:uncharacterized protein A4U43_C06F10870 [Asparagus officinalis]